MEDEATIAARLKQNIPVPAQNDAQPTATKPAPMGHADTPVPFTMDETTLYKLHTFFDVEYTPYSKETIKQAKYIYEHIAQRIGKTDYQDVIGEAHKLLQMIGVNRSDRKMYKLYQWLKLNNAREKVEKEMGALREW